MVQYVTLCEEEDSLCGPVCDRGGGGICVVQCVTVTILSRKNTAKFLKRLHNENKIQIYSENVEVFYSNTYHEAQVKF